MQGGLEVLELQLERLPGSERCAPTVERLQRTVRDMSATVGILLLLARRPENIELEPVDLALLVRDTAQGQDCFSLELPESREVQAQPALAGIVVKNLRGACPCPGRCHAGRQRSGAVAGAPRLRAAGLVGELPAQRRK